DPMGEAGDLGDLDPEAFERRRYAAGPERGERPELAGLLVVPEHRAPIDADQAGGDADNGGQELLGVGPVAGPLRDAQERGENLLFVDLVSIRQRPPFERTR